MADLLRWRSRWQRHLQRKQPRGAFSGQSSLPARCCRRGGSPAAAATRARRWSWIWRCCLLLLLLETAVADRRRRRKHEYGLHHHVASAWSSAHNVLGALTTPNRTSETDIARCAKAFQVFRRHCSKLNLEDAVKRHTALCSVPACSLSLKALKISCLGVDVHGYSPVWLEATSPPPGAVTNEGSPPYVFYLIRADYDPEGKEDGAKTPGVDWPGHDVHIPFGGKEVVLRGDGKYKWEYLMKSPWGEYWEPAIADGTVTGEIPHGAVTNGAHPPKTKYVIRASYDPEGVLGGSQTLGYYKTGSKGGAYIPYGGHEVKLQGNYEFLLQFPSGKHPIRLDDALTFQCGPICNSLTCPMNYVPKVGAEAVHCEADPCDASKDRDLCCVMDTSCGSVTCPEGFVLKASAPTLFCDGEICDGKKDRDRCCDARATCKSLTCAASYVARQSALDSFCAGRVCYPDRDRTTCCDHVDSCTSLECPVGYLPKSNAVSLDCKGMFCDDSDRDTCCDKKTQTCQNLACPASFVLRTESLTEFCEKLECDPQIDRDRCCEVATCDTLRCPKGFVLTMFSRTQHCKSLVCSIKADQSTCCHKEGGCMTLDCPPNFVHKANAAELMCASVKCSQYIDRDTCCELAATCASVDCDSATILREDAHEVFCKGLTCDESVDRELCCLPKAVCSAAACPANYVLKAAAQHRRLQLAPAAPAGGSTLYCAGTTCVPERDHGECCHHVAACQTLTCPANYIDKPYASRRFCAGLACDVDVDRDTCCDEAATCDTVECPAGFVLKKNSKDLYCAGLRCDAYTDGQTCCQKEGTCATLKCPSSFVMRPRAAHIYCKDPVCTVDVDRDTCCEPVATCDRLLCPRGFVLKTDPQELFCAGVECHPDDDKGTCCDEKPSCSAMQCPLNYIPKDVDNSSEPILYCTGLTCDARVDRDICCDEAASCSTVGDEVAGCPKTYELKAAAPTLYCAGRKCHMTQKPAAAPTAPAQPGAPPVVDDVTTCCAQEGTCATLTPPPGYIAKPDNDKTRCSAATCDPQNLADLKICCDEAAMCGEYACPDLYEPVANGSAHFCRGRVCDHRPHSRDIDRCCMGTCATLACPNGMETRPDAKKILCYGQVCSLANDDAKRCCLEPPAWSYLTVGFVVVLCAIVGGSLVFVCARMVNKTSTRANLMGRGGYSMYDKVREGSSSTFNEMPMLVANQQQNPYLNVHSRSGLGGDYAAQGQQLVSYGAPGALGSQRYTDYPTTPRGYTDYPTGQQFGSGSQLQSSGPAYTHVPYSG
eukprot:gnl/TRDRNA2_/TRDRNA2_43417_c0_seq1.p1 gnl/TRDRNA2_/TRDRNA2_43417_c0~~gnl/TRDRNA2_/TRDRNA2_43417_c0_seq1.p1  ORF type:complete len:1277 (+),score=176.57 gnl/TRDRNA2_/TRDRNA2_43417_c0_seq1:95-3925(+)